MSLNSRIRKVAAATVAVIATVALAAVFPAHTVGAAVRQVLHAQTAPPASPLARFAELVAKLHLTDQQKEQIRGVLKAHKDAGLSLAESELAERTELSHAIHRATVDAHAVRAASASVAALDLDVALELGKVYAEVYPILSADQRAQIDAFREAKKAQAIERLKAAFGPGGKVQQFWARAAEKLELTADQRAQIKAVFDSHKTTIVALMIAKGRAHEGVAAACRQPEFNADAIKQAFVPLAKADVAAALERAQIYSEIYQVLNADQRTKVEKFAEMVQQKVTERVEAILALVRELL